MYVCLLKMQSVHRERLSGPACVHVLPFQAFLESDRAAYLIRPYIFADLYHRLSTRPFLSSIEKVTICSFEAPRQSTETDFCA